MKIALINENSQAAKNGIIEAALKKVVEPMGHEVVNYGMYAADDKAQLTYVQCGILAAILLMTQMEFVMMASNYDGSITVDVAFRSGTKVEVMNQRIQTLEDALLSDENFESVTLDLSGNTASFTAYSVDNCDRSSEAAVEEYTARFGSVPDMDVSVSPSGAMDMSALMSSNSKDVVLLGSDLDTLQTAAEQVEEAMTQVPGVIRIENPFRSSQSKGRIVINSQKAMALGTSESAVAMQIYYLLEGMNATSVDYGDTEYDVVLEYPEGKYDDISALLDYPITTQTGQQVALRDISTVEYITTLPTITRQESPALRSAQMVSSILPSVVVISAPPIPPSTAPQKRSTPGRPSSTCPRGCPSAWA